MGGRGLAARAADDGRSHEDLGPELNIVFWLLTGLAFVFLALRIYCKLHRGRRLWWDDHLLIASWVCNFHHWQHTPRWHIVKPL
jgi:hypothetical protein